MRARRDHRPSFADSGCVKNKPVRGVKQTIYLRVRGVVEAYPNNFQVIVKNVHTFDTKNAADFIEWYEKIRISLSIYDKTIFRVLK